MSNRPAKGDDSIMKNVHKRQKQKKRTQTSKVAAATAVAINHGGGDRREKRKIEDREGKELPTERPKHNKKTPATIRDEKWAIMEDVATSDTEVKAEDIGTPGTKVKLEEFLIGTKDEVENVSPHTTQSTHTVARSKNVEEEEDEIFEELLRRSIGRWSKLKSTSPGKKRAGQRKVLATLTTKRNANDGDINDWISCIREVFPLVSRAKVEKLLNKAKSFTTNDDEEDAYHTVMTVLAECGDPTGMTISDASFAAASVGRDRDGDEDNSKLKSTSPGKKRAGQRKVATLECKCCYVEYEFESMVSCRSGHLFCGTCLQKHTEQRVFGIGNFGVKPTEGQQTSKALEILCMTSGCASGFREGQLRKALSDKVMKKYDELQFAAVIESAQMKDVFKCPKCHYIAVRDESLPPLLFNCPQCLFNSCTECGEEFHPKILCDQVESKNETDGRTKVEEAMTLALVRICPKPLCKKKILKNEGCNKMTCACGTLLCYVCGKEILSTVGYKHFCQT